ncbi:CD177 antigen-like [Trichosurus vulpecula]|uniref:CD177 antigen-like n=1 Tax=Trichosurus vulpecula TaxID=9337 RepID=UPI00186AE98F|nr:CD177 antigen-like [Trichosurus vulpecula]
MEVGDLNACPSGRGSKALVCKKGYLIHDDDRSAFPVSWTIHLNETCQPGEGCQETLILLESGQQLVDLCLQRPGTQDQPVPASFYQKFLPPAGNRVGAVISHGCTGGQAHEAKDIQHRAGPGVTIASLTKVCHSDLCNDLETSVPLWTPEPTDAPAQGGLRCPVCVSPYSCPSDAPLVTCPSGTTHCYSGTIQLSGGGLSHPLRVQGCVPHNGCQLLNGTTAIGTISLTESCESEGSQDTRTLVCFKGHLVAIKDKSDFPLSFTASYRETCEPGEACQDTLILLESGDRVAIAFSKGCQRGRTREPLNTWHRRPPGVTISSYTHVCHSDLCNNLSSTFPLWRSRPPTAAPSSSGLQCPTCVALGSSCSSTALSLCPEGTSQCYQGLLQLSGGGITRNFSIQGCAPEAVTGCRLLGNTQAFGPIAVTEESFRRRLVGAAAVGGGRWRWPEPEPGLKWSSPTMHYARGVDTLKVYCIQSPCRDTGPQNLKQELEQCSEAAEAEEVEWSSPFPCEVEYGTGAGVQSCLHVDLGRSQERSRGDIISYTKVCSFNQCNDINSTASILSPAPSGSKALVCKKGYLIHDDNRSAFPVSWTIHLNETCQPGEGCQETLILLESGNRVGAVISHGCTGGQTHEAKDIQHRAGPGVTIASLLTKVCHSDLCNDLETSVPLWTPEPTDAPAQGGLQCPVCVSPYSCPSDAPLVTCPSGTTHCYSGTIQLSGGGLSHPLRVQGCVPHNGCQLLNGTTAIGPISLTESCESEGSQDTRALVCFKGIPSCNKGQIRFPPLIYGLLQRDLHPRLPALTPGDRVAIVLSKGCQRGRTREPLNTWHRRPPGVTISSYTHVCHSDLCNNLSSTIPLWRSQPPTAAPSPSGLQCPMCVALGSSCSSTALSLCPEGTSRDCCSSVEEGLQLTWASRAVPPKPSQAAVYLETPRLLGPLL